MSVFVVLCRNKEEVYVLGAYLRREGAINHAVVSLQEEAWENGYVLPSEEELIETFSRGDFKIGEATYSISETRINDA